MKEGIHPAYEEATITCACGNVMKVGSTKKDIKVDINIFELVKSKASLTQ